MPTNTCPPWVLMWVLAGGIYAACKWLTWSRTPTMGATTGRQLAYLFAWPGMDAKAFLAHRLPEKARPKSGEWLFAAAKTALGIGLVWGVVPLVPADSPLLRGWVGMVGFVLLLHFGTFHLLSCFWRSREIDARPLMDWPVMSKSVSEFWGKRWNTAFRDLTFRFLFRPVADRFGPKGGVVVGFLASGIVHDLVISVPAGGGYGLPTLYFVLQGIGLLAERSAAGKTASIRSGWRGRLFTAAVVLGPAYALFHPPFVTRVILPFLEVIGAT
jgi:Membrane bound O-acyl transferase family